MVIFVTAVSVPGKGMVVSAPVQGMTVFVVDESIPAELRFSFYGLSVSQGMVGYTFYSYECPHHILINMLFEADIDKI